MMRFQVLLYLWSVTRGLCLDKIPEVAKTKVSKPKRYSLSNLRLCHAPLKWLIQAFKALERGVTLPTRLVVFGQSQCSESVGQSKQTALVGGTL